MRTLEGFFLLNAALDAGLLIFAACWRGDRVRPLNCCLGALFGATYAVVAAMLGGPLRSYPALCLSAVLMVALLGRAPLRGVVRSTGALWTFALLLGGASGAGLSLFPACAVTGASGAWLLRRKSAPPPERARLTIRQGNTQKTMDAIIDTGNRAVEPCTGLPVVFVERGNWALEAGRVICVRTAAGTKLLPCFAPDTLLLDGDPRKAVVACCEEGSLECALVPWALCAERKAANALFRRKGRPGLFARPSGGAYPKDPCRRADDTFKTVPGKGRLHRGGGCIARAAHTR